VKDTWYILGAGAIGSLFACKLQQAGIETCLIDRTGTPQDITLVTADDKQQLSIPRSTLASLPDQAVHKLLITTKAQQAVTAWMQARPCLAAGAAVVLMHNGMGIAEQIQARHPDTPIYLGTTTEAAHFNASGELVHVGRGDTLIGGMNTVQAPSWFWDLANSDQRFSWEADIEASLWRKLIVNCAINPLTAIHACSNGELARNPDLREQVKILCKELAMITVARGYPEFAADVSDFAFAIARSTADNRSSMMLDVQSGRRSEIEYITGYLVSEALRLGVACPVNKQLLEQIRARDSIAARSNQ
jgi:2-dehydropantoate 2-reductase